VGREGDGSYRPVRSRSASDGDGGDSDGNGDDESESEDDDIIHVSFEVDGRDGDDGEGEGDENSRSAEGGSRTVDRLEAVGRAVGAGVVVEGRASTDWRVSTTRA
jgi:hypothetical protein